jgi:hypothetical protein
MKYDKIILLGFAIFLIALVVLHLILSYWTNYQYKDLNIIIVKDITSSWDAQYFEITAISKQKRFFKLRLKDSTNSQKVLLPVFSPKYSFWDNTWRTRIYIKAFANGNISILPNSTAEPKETFSVATCPVPHDVRWYVSYSNRASYRKIPAGVTAICTILTGAVNDNNNIEFYFLESVMDEKVSITH